ncbi:hypothetical protein AB0M44_30985 [Streptosporangium subroseum]
MSPDQIVQTLATLNKAIAAQRPTISTSSCTTPGCTAKGCKR